ncbi:MAG: cell division protein ZapA [Prevotella sp.]|nr:cell division protein ZapA [Prevotella sp.]MCI1685182.1 cell division protein ZapA [Prevotella sp.]MCI1802321.1 cell division protein ZapA [Prevotella sp.]MCI1817054.1 cell division protein ZapA [Prevotella sp.]MCI1847841.1 cell division protein ZapA [Prevotella sp.]MCI2087218.1 cell division protein ZapA [Prevotella sp.]
MAEEDKEKLTIRLNLHDTMLSVRIPRDDQIEEEYYRKAAKLINEVVNTYSSHYKEVKSDKEILYMCLVDIAMRYEKQKGQNDTAPYNTVLSQLTSEIEEVLRKE